MPLKEPFLNGEIPEHVAVKMVLLLEGWQKGGGKRGRVPRPTSFGFADPWHKCKFLGKRIE